jgi:hypothetical protein
MDSIEHELGAQPIETAGPRHHFIDIDLLLAAARDCRIEATGDPQALTEVCGIFSRPSLTSQDVRQAIDLLVPSSTPEFYVSLERRLDRQYGELDRQRVKMFGQSVDDDSSRILRDMINVEHNADRLLLEAANPHRAKRFQKFFNWRPQR